MLIEHKVLGLVDFNLVPYVAKELEHYKTKESLLLAIKVNNRIHLHCSPINLITGEIKTLKLESDHHLIGVTLKDKKYVFPRELINSHGTDLNVIYSNHGVTDIRDQIFTQLALHSELEKTCIELWQEYESKTLQLRLDLHRVEEFALYSKLENYRRKKGYTTQSSAVKDLLYIALNLDEMGYTIEANQLYTQEVMCE